jgi:hypothetical protein
MHRQQRHERQVAADVPPVLLEAAAQLLDDPQEELPALPP